MRNDYGLMDVLLQEFLAEQGAPARLAPRCPGDGKDSHFLRKFLVA